MPRPPTDTAREVGVPAAGKARLAILMAGLRQAPRFATSDGAAPWEPTSDGHLATWSECRIVTFDADDATTGKAAVAKFVDDVRKAPNDAAARRVTITRGGRPPLPRGSLNG